MEDVAYRVIAANLVPDHSTIADFRVRHEAALAEVFTGVLGLCKRAGLASVGVVAIDGTKVRANAARANNRSYAQIAKEILEEAAATDRLEDELYGDQRGDELPEQLRTPEGRKAALRKAKQQLEQERKAEQEANEDEPRDGAEADAEAEIEFDPQRFVGRGHGRREWLREGRRALEQQREAKPRKVSRSRVDRLFEAARRLEEELTVDGQANATYEAWRARASRPMGRAGWRPGRRSPTSRRSCRTGRSRSPTPTRG